MKIFQVADGFCIWDATTKFQTVDSAMGKFPPDVLFVEAPDYVFEGWGYDAEKEGDERFIKPTPPDGWLYDRKSGTFYPVGGTPQSTHVLTETELLGQEVTEQELNLIEAEQRITELELMILEEKQSV